MRTAARVIGLTGMLWTLPTGAPAQLSEGGRFELGAFALYTRYDPTRLALNADLGVGARAAWFLTPAFSLEATASRTGTRSTVAPTRVNVHELGAGVLASARVGGANRVYAGGGFSWLTHDGGVSYTDRSLHAVVGDRVPLSRMAALRIEARALHTPKSNAPTAAGAAALRLAVSAGMSIFFAERPPRDSDGDLIADANDQCAATPGGALVDARGCPRDSDSDGVYEGLDRCPGTPVGAGTDAGGCPLDGDQDGVPDHGDRCANTAPGLDVDERGCPLDGDGDGVADYQDRCTNTASGIAVDDNGCPRDSDGDGVTDDRDRCPGTATAPRVDEVGCPILFEEREGERVPLVLTGVNFQLNEAVLTPESHAALDEVAASLVAHPEVRVEVAGHTDDLGTPQRNAALSLARAEAVRSYLISRGVISDRLVVRGYGATMPVAGNDNDAGRALNRRVELRLIGN